MTNSARTVSAADAKAHLSELVSKVQHGGERYVINRRGKPVAALVSLNDLDRIVSEAAPSLPSPSGLSLLTLPSYDLDDPAARELDSAIDEMVAEIYEAREREIGRPAPDFGDE